MLIGTKFISTKRYMLSGNRLNEHFEIIDRVDKSIYFTVPSRLTFQYGNLKPSEKLIYSQLLIYSRHLNEDYILYLKNIAEYVE